MLLFLGTLVIQRQQSGKVIMRAEGFVRSLLLKQVFGLAVSRALDFFGDGSFYLLDSPGVSWSPFYLNKNMESAHSHTDSRPWIDSMHLAICADCVAQLPLLLPISS